MPGDVRAHAIWRALVLVLLGVFLSSLRTSQTNWDFVNVLSQIGLAYLFVYALMGRRFWIQLLALVVILVGYWGFFYSYTPPEDYDYAAVNAADETVLEGQFASWSKNANAGHNVDVWLLNKFPRREGDVFRSQPRRLRHVELRSFNCHDAVGGLLRSTLAQRKTLVAEVLAPGARRRRLYGARPAGRHSTRVLSSNASGRPRGCSSAVAGSSGCWLRSTCWSISAGSAGSHFRWWSSA